MTYSKQELTNDQQNPALRKPKEFPRGTSRRGTDIHPSGLVSNQDQGADAGQ